MVTLFFVVVELGHVSLVHIETSESVSDLKAKIKEAKPNTVYFDAALLRVYLARDRDGEWLSSDDDEYKALKRREVPTAIQELMTDELELDSTARLSDEAYFGTEFTRGDGQINLLVKMPTDDERGETGGNKWIMPLAVLIFVATLLAFGVATWMQSSIKVIIGISVVSQGASKALEWWEEYDKANPAAASFMYQRIP